jgi:hypothetical protein
MSKYSKSRDIAYYLTSKPKIIASLFIALLAVFILLLDEVSTHNIGHSQIMPTNSSSVSNGSSSSLTENSTLSDFAEEKNNTSSLPSANDIQNSSTSGILSNSSLATTSTNNTNSTDSLQNATKTQNPLPQVKIISHTKSQKVPEGTLSINGVSSDDSASTCDVYVILNGIKPYQRVTPTGESGSINGTKDYSLWKFTFLPTYGLISEGDNKMTAKITCINGSLNATKFNSLNVTGVSSTPTNTSTSITQTPVPLQSSENVTTTDNLDTAQGNSTSLMTASPAPTNGQQQQAPATQSITPQTPQTPQTNYYGISPSSPLSTETPTQNSSFIQQQEQLPANNIGSDSDQSDSVGREVSLRTKEAVDKFIARVQGTVEERFEEAIKMRTPFELVTPTPFDSEDLNDSNNNDDDGDGKQADN